jgi:uncharacterized protein YjbI with pentapeptide repeats
LAEQRQQLDRTLAEQRERTLNERFGTAADKLGSDKPAAVRLAGVYAMAGLADDWAENRQACVDVLCGYLRMPYSPDPGQDAPERDRLAFLADSEVRHTIIRVIAAHLRREAGTSWSEMSLDFTGVRFDGGEFENCQFAGEVSFSRAEFSGSVKFGAAEFSGTVEFFIAKFSGTVDFGLAGFSGGVYFGGAEFSGDGVYFGGAEFSGGTVSFNLARFSGGDVSFNFAGFSGGNVSFAAAEISGSKISFRGANFTGGKVDFNGARFSGGKVDLGRAVFSGGTVDFTKVAVWSHPPTFDFTDTPPAPVRLPSSPL